MALTRHGDEIPVACVLVAHRGPDGRIDRVSAITRDLSESRRREASLQHHFTHDELTGLPNRTLLMDRLGVALARSPRLATGVAVLCCDLDRFKVVNEGLGADGADEVLLQVAERLGRERPAGRHRGSLRERRVRPPLLGPDVSSRRSRAVRADPGQRYGPPSPSATTSWS